MHRLLCERSINRRDDLGIDPEALLQSVETPVYLVFVPGIAQYGNDAGQVRRLTRRLYGVSTDQKNCPDLPDRRLGLSW